MAASSALLAPAEEVAKARSSKEVLQAWKLTELGAGALVRAEPPLHKAGTPGTLLRLLHRIVELQRWEGSQGSSSPPLKPRSHNCSLQKNFNL